MLSKYEIENNLRWDSAEICKDCKGKYCCQQMACFCSPEDFQHNTDLMFKALKSGNYSIDFIRNSSQSFRITKDTVYLDVHSILFAPGEALFIRPKNKNRPTVDILHREEDIEGPCIFWSLEKGCEFKYEDRPKFGRATIAKENHDCKCHFTTDDMAKEWKPYTLYLFDFAKKFFPSDWELYKEINFIL